MKNIKHVLLTLLILTCASSAWARMGVLALGGGAPASGLDYLSYSATGATDVNQTSLVITNPTGTGGTLIAVISTNATGGVTPPSGWTLVSNSYTKIYKKTVSSEESSHAFTVGTYTYPHGVIMRISGTVGSVASSEVYRGSWDSTIDFPGPVVSKGDSIVVWVATLAGPYNLVMSSITRGTIIYQNSQFTDLKTVPINISVEKNVAAGNPITAASGTDSGSGNNKYGTAIVIEP